MKREINLLPPDFRAQRHRQLYGRGVARLLRRLDAGLLLVAIIFGGVYLALRLMIGASDPKLASISNQSNLDQQVQQANELLTAIETRLTNAVPWTPQVAELLRAMPAELTVTSLTASDRTKELTIEGISRNRAAVVTFEQTIRALPWVATVESPLQNFATGSRTTFTLIIKRAEVKP